MIARWEGLGGWVKISEEIRSTKGQLQSSHEDVKYRTGNTVSNIVVTVVARWVADLSGEHFVSYLSV